MILVACRKQTSGSGPGSSLPPLGNGLYVLIQGRYDTGIILPTDTAYKSSLTFYSFSSKMVIPDQYMVANRRELGIQASDMKIYGSKLYLVLGGSSVVNITDAWTGKLIRQDSLVTTGSAYPPGSRLYYAYFRVPSSIYFNNGLGFISCDDGTIAVLDTATLDIMKYITAGPVGSYPAGMVAAGGKLYVSMSSPFSDSISVFDLTSMSRVKKIQVLPNPTTMAADSYGNVYVASAYDAIFYLNQGGVPDPPHVGGITIIDSRTDLIKSQTVVDLAINQPIALSGDLLYYLTDGNSVAVFNAKTQTAVSANFLKDNTSISQASALAVNPSTGEVFVADEKLYDIMNGAVYAFDRTGKLEYSFATGVSPSRLVLLNQ